MQKKDEARTFMNQKPMQSMVSNYLHLLYVTACCFNRKNWKSMAMTFDVGYMYKWHSILGEGFLFCTMNWSDVITTLWSWQSSAAEYRACHVINPCIIWTSFAYVRLIWLFVRKIRRTCASNHGPGLVQCPSMSHDFKSCRVYLTENTGSISHEPNRAPSSAVNLAFQFGSSESHADAASS